MSDNDSERETVAVHMWCNVLNRYMQLITEIFHCQHLSDHDSLGDNMENY